MKIVATVGPASRHLIEALWNAGATDFRLNASHMQAGELGRIAASIRRLLPGSRLAVDLQGAKMRLGRFAERLVHAGDKVAFTMQGRPGTIPLPHDELFSAVQADDTLSCDDDRLRFRVVSGCNDTLDSVSLMDGVLRPRKGVNLLEHPVDPEGLTASDLAAVRAVKKLGGVSFAFSFMKDGREAAWIRREAAGSAVIGKIERREAAENVRGIARAVDQLWICRGDLGAQLGHAGMARWISDYRPRGAGLPVYMAGQVLEHMTSHPAPTRAEVCHLFDLVRRGYAGFVLSDETAVGMDPVGAVQTARSLLENFHAARPRLRIRQKQTRP